MSAPQTPDRPGSVNLADGEWHRMHPLTPILKGGVSILIIAGLLWANLQDRIIRFFVAVFAPEATSDYDEYGAPDPLEWLLQSDILLWVLLAAVGIVLVALALFWLAWRFSQFRITGKDVEVRKGIIFRSHRRAPLDRVQGVNLTRPFIARLIGLAKLEVLGAGTDSNVEMSYLATGKAEAVRADILRLASGARAAKAPAAPASGTTGAALPLVGAPGELQPSRTQQFAGSVSDGVSGVISGVDMNDVPPEHVMRIPTGRLIGAHLMNAVALSGLFAVILAIVAVAVGIGVALDPDEDSDVGVPFVMLITAIPLVLTLIGLTVSRILQGLRYTIAPTSDGLRITFGVLTTVTENLPPGRIFAVEVVQPLLWRPFGWWFVRINRLSGQSAAQQSANTSQQQMANTVLPVGKREDVEWILRVLLPQMPADEILLLWQQGVMGPVEGDPYRTMPKRAAWRRPFSWKRHGYAFNEQALLMRRGAIWRSLAIFPLARLQGIAVHQGPIDRAQRVARGRVHSTIGQVLGYVSALERADALELVTTVAQAAVRAADSDRTHRWGEHAQQAPQTVAASVPQVAFAPVPPAPFTPPAPPAPPAPPSPFPAQTTPPQPPSTHPAA